MLGYRAHMTRNSMFEAFRVFRIAYSLSMLEQAVKIIHVLYLRFSSSCAEVCLVDVLSIAVILAVRYSGRLVISINPTLRFDFHRSMDLP